MAAALLLPPARDRRDSASREALLRRVSGEFNEMPCLCLTLGQAQRLFGLRADVCQRVFAALVRQGRLTCHRDDRYRLNDSRIWPAPSRLFRPVPVDEIVISFRR